MFEPITFSLIIQTFTIAAAAATVAVMAYLCAIVVRDYIREHRTKQNVNAKTTVMVEKLKNGDYSVATGFLEGNTNIVDSKVWKAKTLDEEFHKFPVGKPVIVES